jgi:hypothetical protein
VVLILLGLDVIGFRSCHCLGRQAGCVPTCGRWPGQHPQVRGRKHHRGAEFIDDGRGCRR